MISISHAPNSTIRQQLLSLRLLASGSWLRKRPGKHVQAFVNALEDLHGASGKGFAFSKGREALFAAIQACGIGEGDEVILQGYTCLVVPHAVIWNGAKPVYADIDETYNIDPNQVRSLITEKTKAIIVQHTFGIPGNIEELLSICKEHGLYLIEDCAHALGASFKNRLVGTFGDIAIFSFGRDKIISSISGGAALVNNQDLYRRMAEITSDLPSPRRFWALQNLFHAAFMPVFSRLQNNVRIGQVLIRICQGLRLLNKVYSPEEYASESSKETMYLMPQSMARLAKQQLDELRHLNEIRRAHAKAYTEFCVKKAIPFQQVEPQTSPVYLRFALQVEDPEHMVLRFQKQGFLLGDWYNQVIVPKPVMWEKIGYAMGTCPRAEKLSKTSLNLPTHRKLTKQQRSRLLALLENEL